MRHETLRDDFTVLAERYRRDIYRAALRMAPNFAAAEDLAQETFLKAWRYFHTFQAGTNVRPWLLRILRNASIDAYRKAKREPELVDQADVDDLYLFARVPGSEERGRRDNPEEIVLADIMDADVERALESLPEAFRAPVILADLKGFSHKQIAASLGVPIGTVMSRLFRGRRSIARVIGRRSRPAPAKVLPVLPKGRGVAP